MDRVTDFESGGCAFDPRRGHLSDKSRVLAKEHALYISARKCKNFRAIYLYRRGKFLGEIQTVKQQQTNDKAIRGIIQA
jgi:hypothetical protein